jgi:hypothetical protein
MLFSSAALAQTPPRGTLAVHVSNGASVPPWVLAEAGREVERIFAEIGVGTIWAVTRSGDEPAPIKTSPGEVPAHVAIIIIPKPLPSFPLEIRSNDHVTGGTIGVISYVFYDRIWRLLTIHSSSARMRDLLAGRFLGYCIAHELGHLLMLGRAHSKEGIMRAALGPYDLGSARFSAEEAKLIIGEIERRTHR